MTVSDFPYLHDARTCVWCLRFTTKKEKPMPNVYTTAMVISRATMLSQDGRAVRRVTIAIPTRLAFDDPMLDIGKEVAVTTVPPLVAGPSPEEQAVIDAAVRLIDSIGDPYPVTGAISAMEQVRRAVKAMREAI